MKLASSGQPGDWRTRASDQLPPSKTVMELTGDAEQSCWSSAIPQPWTGECNWQPNSGSATDAGPVDSHGRSSRPQKPVGRRTEGIHQRSSESRSATENWQLVFSATLRQSQVLESQQQHWEAHRRLVEVAKKLADHEHAPAAHLRGCWNLIQTIGTNTESATEIKQKFLDSLDEHLERWPDSPTANQARLWAGRQLQNQHQWQQAFQRYTAISTDSPFFADAIKQSYVCMRELMKASPASLAQAREFTEVLKQFAVEPDVTARGRVELMLTLAQIGFSIRTRRK